jgi:hypothetical protein
MSITIMPGFSDGSMASTASPTCLLVGTMITTQSAPAAASAGVAAAFAPVSVAKDAARPGATSHTVTSKPAFTRLAAMGQPILPMPAKAMRFSAADITSSPEWRLRRSAPHARP